MAQWGNKRQPVSVNATSTVETTEGAPIGTYTLVKGGGGDNANWGNTAGSRANTDLAMYKANAPFPTLPGMKVGVIPVAVTDLVNPNSSVLTQSIFVDVGGANSTARGVGYPASPTAYANVVFANGYTAVNFLQLNIDNVPPGIGAVNNMTQVDASPRGTVFTSAVTSVNFPPPPPEPIEVCNGIGFSNVTNMINLANADLRYNTSDQVFYQVPTGNTPIAPLTGNTNYWLFSVNSSGVVLKSSTLSSTPIDLTDTRSNTTVYETHSLNGIKATVRSIQIQNTYNTGAGLGANATPSPVAHAGWVVKREGTGGRAGRVHYETLVAMHSLANT